MGAYFVLEEVKTMPTLQSAEILVKKPPSGLSLFDMAMVGSTRAQSWIVGLLPEMGVKAPAGLTPIEWAALGLQSAKDKLEELINNR
jgi:hypothetical protein